MSIYLARVWYRDYQDTRRGRHRRGALPGATPAETSWIVLGAIVGSLLVLLQTAGECRLGITAKQSRVTWLFLLAMVSAGFLEEVVFRGFLVIDHKGRAALVGSIVGFSALFALLHFHWLDWKGAGEGWARLELNAAAAWWTLSLFLNSLLFYWLRFSRWNRGRSLIPCFAGHIASNVTVFAVKLFQGYVGGLY